MNFDGDVRLICTTDGGDVAFANGQPDMDQGLETAVYISLFSSKTWWGNALGGSALGSDLETILSQTLSNRTRLDAEEYARQALRWMLEEGIAKAVTVAATIPRVDTLLLTVTVEQPGNAISRLRYQINWAAQRVRMEA